MKIFKGINVCLRCLLISSGDVQDGAGTTDK
jgi:hypothetical protein